MGLLLTLQEAEGWHGQYRRMLRWHERICAIDTGRSSAEQLDFLIAFFVACFHLRDWLKDSGLETERLNALFRGNIELRICRDFANGFKHSCLDREPFHDRAFSVLREHVPAGWPSDLGHSNSRWSIVAGDDKFDLIELAGRCVLIWNVFLDETLCPWAPASFDPARIAEGARARRALPTDSSGTHPNKRGRQIN